MTELALTIMAICAVAMVRNELVYSVRTRRIKEISSLNRRELGRPDFIEVMERRYAELDRTGYHAMVLDLRCWTYRQFYPSEVV